MIVGVSRDEIPESVVLWLCTELSTLSTFESSDISMIFIDIINKEEAIKMDIQQMTQKARQASRSLATLQTDIKNAALSAIASALHVHAERIFTANTTDLKRCEAEGLAQPLLKRLRFDREKLQTVIAGIDSLIRIKDPVGETLLATELDEGLDLYRVSCPIGVIGVIFESRPDALIQISTLCLKSGNAALLKGGSEARETNQVLTEIINAAAQTAGVPDGWIGLLESRLDVNALLNAMNGCPLSARLMSLSSILWSIRSLFSHADGVCHLHR